MRPVVARVELRPWEGARVWASLRAGGELDGETIARISPVLDAARVDGVLKDAWFDHGDVPEWSWRARAVLLALESREELAALMGRLSSAGVTGVRVTLEGEVRPKEIATATSARGRHARTEPGRYGDVELHLAPSASRSLTITAGPDLVPELREYFDDVVDGVRWAASRGNEPGRPVVSGNVTWTQGRFHPVDSARSAYRVAAARAFLDAISRPGVLG